MQAIVNETTNETLGEIEQTTTGWHAHVADYVVVCKTRDEAVEVLWDVYRSEGINA